MRTGGPEWTRSPNSRGLKKALISSRAFCCRAGRLGRFCLRWLEPGSCGNEGFVGSCGGMGGCSCRAGRGSQGGCAGAPWQLLGTARWEISKRESPRNADCTEQLLPALRLFPGGSFMCWDCQNEIFSQFPARGKLKKRTFSLIRSKAK